MCGASFCSKRCSKINLEGRINAVSAAEMLMEHRRDCGSTALSKIIIIIPLLNIALFK